VPTPSEGAACRAKLPAQRFCHIAVEAASPLPITRIIWTNASVNSESTAAAAIWSCQSSTYRRAKTSRSGGVFMP
jgi:hypothetical protein